MKQPLASIGNFASRRFFGGLSRNVLGLTLCATVAFVASTGMSEAQQVSPAMRQACGDDFQSLCSGVQPGGGRILACLKENSAHLSLNCRKALSRMKSAQ